MKIAVALALILSSLAAEGANPNHVRFEYSNDGAGEVLSCTHKALGELGWDWEVSCGEGRKKFHAHLVVTELQRERAPQTYLEILYHVMMLNSDSAFTSQASWIFLNEKSSMVHVGLSQGVENGQGSLLVEADWERPSAP